MHLQIVQNYFEFWQQSTKNWKFSKLDLEPKSCQTIKASKIASAASLVLKYV